MEDKKIHSLLAPSECALALIDYQPAMFSGVQSHDRSIIVQNIQIVAKAAKLFDVPAILSTVAAESFIGTMISEITCIFTDQTPINRSSLNAWRDPAFRRAIEDAGRRKIVMAGLWTEACVLCPALDMLNAGYEVYVPIDACGDMTEDSHRQTLQRLSRAGAVSITSLQFLFELQKDWARKETYGSCMEIMRGHAP